MDNESKRTVFFATPEEAANRAKNDLLAVMRSHKEMALGVEAAAIERSQPAKALKQYQITFDELLSADSFARFIGNELATVVPLVADDNVVTTAEVAKDEKGWRIAGLSDKALAEDINTVRRAVGAESEIVIYALPHAQFRIYGVVSAAQGQATGPTLYTSYPGFSLKEPVSTEQLLSALKRDAAEFREKYGDALKKQKLSN
ncbi:MAG TPA: hypothetical protein VF626_05920 [Chthoniobacterales bacterium]